MNDSPYAPERRPIASRERKVFQRLAARLAQMGVSANGISIAGMVSGVSAGILFALTPNDDLRIWCFLAAAAFIQLRLLANMLDGMVALATHTASPVGELYNEVPDRVSDAAICIGAGYAAASWPMLGYMAACVALFVAYVRAQGKVAGAHQEFCGPMAKQQRMFVLTVAAAYCALAPLSWQPILFDSSEGGVMSIALAIIVVGGVLTALRRLVRIARALRSHKP